MTEYNFILCVFNLLSSGKISDAYSLLKNSDTDSADDARILIKKGEIQEAINILSNELYNLGDE